jgi:excisionase family DNA binding protein
METVFLSMPKNEFEAVIIDCVKSCLDFTSTTFSETALNECEKPTDVIGAADHVNLDEQTIYRLVRQKEIPFHKQGKKLYFYKSELNTWIKSGKGKTMSELRQEAEAETLSLNKKRA